MRRVKRGRDIDAALTRKGFRCDRDGDHLFYHFDGPRVKTKISHGMMGRTIGPELLALMARQLRLTKHQFINFIDCTLSKEAYRALMAEESGGVAGSS